MAYMQVVTGENESDTVSHIQSTCPVSKGAYTMNYKTLFLAASAACVLTVNAASAEGITSNVGFATDYVFRGISKTDENPAIQGGFDYADPSGLHIGVWGSNTDFNTTDDGSLELDIYAGYAAEIGAFSYDVGGIYYYYPGADSDLDYNFVEAYFAVAYDMDVALLSAGLNYSPEYFGDSGDGVYFYGGANVPLPHDFSATAHIGFQSIDDSEDYTDWSLGLGYNYMDFDFGLTYFDTDLSNNDNADSRAVLSVSREF